MKFFTERKYSFTTIAEVVISKRNFATCRFYYDT